MDREVTKDNAKEILISLMDFAAYRESGISLLVSDKNRLFGSERYQMESGRADWKGDNPRGEGDAWLEKMAELLRWGIRLGSAKDDVGNAVASLREDSAVIGKVIRKAGI